MIIKRIRWKKLIILYISILWNLLQVPLSIVSGELWYQIPDFINNFATIFSGPLLIEALSNYPITKPIRIPLKNGMPKFSDKNLNTIFGSLMGFNILIAEVYLALCICSTLISNISLNNFKGWIKMLTNTHLNLCRRSTLYKYKDWERVISLIMMD